MGSKTKTTKTQNSANTSQSTQIDPVVMNAALDNYNTAKINAGRLTGYTGERVAGFNDVQRQGQEALMRLSQQPNDGLTEAANIMRGVAQYTPQQVKGEGYQAVHANAAQINRGSIRDVTAGQLKNTDLSAYFNPYVDKVVSTSLADQERARQIALVNDRHRAQGSGAFGGSRHGVAEALTNEASIRAAGGLAAQLRMAGYDNAQQAAIGDLNRILAADQGNQGVDWNVGSQNAAMSTQAALANAAAANQAAQFSAGQNQGAALANQQAGLAGAGLQANAAGMLAGVSQSQLQEAITKAGLLSSVGDAQHAQEQAIRDAAYEEFVRQQNSIPITQNILNSGLAGVPVPTTTTGTSKSSGTEEVRDPGAALGQIAQIGLGIASLTPSSLGVIAGKKLLGIE